MELGVSGQQNLAHRAISDEGGRVVMPEAGAGTERHKLLRTNRSYL
jgi:hypothetical protein